MASPNINGREWFKDYQLMHFSPVKLTGRRLPIRTCQRATNVHISVTLWLFTNIKIPHRKHTGLVQQKQVLLVCVHRFKTGRCIQDGTLVEAEQSLGPKPHPISLPRITQLPS